MALNPEAAAGDRRQAALFDQPDAEGFRIHAEFRDLREDVERAPGFGVGQAHLVKTGQHIFPAFSVDSRHVRDRHLQGRLRGLLQEGGDRGDLSRLEKGEFVDEGLGSRQPVMAQGLEKLWQRMQRARSSGFRVRSGTGSEDNAA